MLNDDVFQTSEPAATDEGLVEDLDLQPTETEDASGEAPAADLTPEGLFSADLSATTLLTRSQEEALARQIARARNRVRAILKRAPRLTRAALSESGGRKLIAPERDFREKETIIILTHAQEALRERRTARITGLDRKGLRNFVTELSDALTHYRGLRDQMVRANVRLVNALARRYRHPTLSLLDLFQEGTLGLIRAVEKYDPQRNIKFSTYATWWIWQQLARAADTYGSLIRTPVYWQQFRRRLSRDEQGLAAENDGAVSREELVAHTGMPSPQFDAMAQTFHFVSTDAPQSDDDDRVLEAVLPSGTAELEEQVMKTGLREQLEAALAQLPTREGLILRQRFGLDDDNVETLEQIGTRFGVSRERIRQLESRALKQLREFCASRGLQDYLH